MAGPGSTLARMPIRLRFLALITVFLVSSVMVMLYNLSQVRALGEQAADMRSALTTAARPATQTLLAVLGNAREVERELRASILSSAGTNEDHSPGGGATSFGEIATLLLQRFQTAVAEVPETLRNPGLPAQAADIAARLERYRKARDAFLAAYAKEDRSAMAEQAGALDAAEPVIIRELGELLEAQVITETDVRAEELRSLVWLGMISLGAILVAVIAAHLISRVLSHQLKGVVSLAGEISARDLSRRIEVRDADDEISQLYAAMAHMSDNVAASIRQIAVISEDVAGGADGIAASSAQIQSELEEELAGIMQIAVSMNEMATTVQEVARNTASAAEEARNADREAQTGREVLQTAIRDINSLSEDLGRLGNVIEELEKRAQSIGSVLDVIQEIAEQTNLLALNAAIEAARAGEQGRGFAVVADEVRTLARRTQESTLQIKDTIDQVQSSARDAGTVMRRNLEHIQTSVERVRESGDSFRTITEAVGSISDMNTQIATAAEEQSNVATEISGNVARVRTSSEGTAKVSAGSENAARELSELAGRLHDLLDEFRT